jgi:hypothetical protein
MGTTGPSKRNKSQSIYTALTRARNVVVSIANEIPPSNPEAPDIVERNLKHNLKKNLRQGKTKNIPDNAVYFD